MSFGADGAPVNLGCNNGAAHLVEVHGCAHRLELAIKSAAKSCSLMTVVDNVMENAFKIYYKSPLCWSGLQETVRALDLPLLKQVKPKGTRFIAHRERELRVILHDWPILVQHASQVHMGRTAMQGRAAQLCFTLLKPDVLSFMYLSYDLFVVLGRLSKTLQNALQLMIPFSALWHLQEPSCLDMTVVIQ